MTKPKSEKPEGESAAVGVRTDAQRKQASAKAKTKTADPVDSDTENTVSAEDSGEVDSIDTDEKDSEQTPDNAESAEAKSRRPWARARGVMDRRASHRPQPRVGGASKTEPESADDQSAQPVEEPLDDTAEKPSEDPDVLDALDSDEAEAALADDADDADDADAEDAAEGSAKVKRRISWPQVVVYGLLPALALVLAGAAGFLKWQDSSARETQLARIESLAAAKDSTIALLSYKSDTVEKDLEAAKGRMTGAFKDSYSQLINDVVIPGAKKEHISTTATVPAAASVSATPNHAVNLLFVNQTAVVDKGQPSDSVSSVRVTLDKVDGRWLISGFDPV